MRELSILIPSRNEMFLKRTIEDILENIEADTDIIAVLDGAWADPPLEQHDRVNIIYTNQPVGQRAAANLACSISDAKYVMKIDAHCSFDKGFDRKMLEAFKKTGDNVTMVPIMRNLHAFDWVCQKCGNRWYQGPTPTHCFSDYKAKEKNVECTSQDFEKEIMWIGKKSPQSTSYLFDSEPHFQYFNAYKKTKKYKKDKKTEFTETMSLQGSAFMLTRKKWWKLKISEGRHGSWGNQGIEVAAKTWLSGGKVLCYHGTWYAHMFRTQGGDFSFPYEQRGRTVQQTKKSVKDQIWDGKIPNQTRPLRWLVERFAPVPGWSDEDIAKLKDLPPPIKV